MCFCRACRCAGPAHHRARISRGMGGERGQYRLAVQTGPLGMEATIRAARHSGSCRGTELQRGASTGTAGGRCVVRVAVRALVRLSLRRRGQSAGTVLRSARVCRCRGACAWTGVARMVQSVPRPSCERHDPECADTYQCDAPGTRAQLRQIPVDGPWRAQRHCADAARNARRGEAL